MVLRRCLNSGDPLQRSLDTRDGSDRLPSAHADPRLRLGQIIGADVELNIPRFACAQMNPFKTTQAANGILRAARAVDIELDHLIAVRL